MSTQTRWLRHVCQVAACALIWGRLAFGGPPGKEVSGKEVSGKEVSTSEAAPGTATTKPANKAIGGFESLKVRGRVVWLAEEMASRYGLKTVPEATQRIIALKTTDGHLIPLAEDIRGRGFRRDERLRNVDLELLVRRYRGAPVVQVIRTFEMSSKGKFELDYWCDICAIAMYELKPCDCCQGDIELRRRPVNAKDEPFR